MQVKPQSDASLKYGGRSSKKKKKRKKETQGNTVAIKAESNCVPKRFIF